MAYTPTILAFAGSARTESFNKKALRIAVAGAESAGARLTHIDLREFPLPLFKNTIDWVSRPAPNEAPLGCFVEKVAVLLSASPGALGGLRGLVHVRAMLSNIHVLVLPDQLAISKAHEAFNVDGSLKEARQHTAAQGLGRVLTEMLQKLKS